MVSLLRGSYTRASQGEASSIATRPAALSPATNPLLRRVFDSLINELDMPKRLVGTVEDLAALIGAVRIAARPLAEGGLYCRRSFCNRKHLLNEEYVANKLWQLREIYSRAQIENNIKENLFGFSM